MRFPTATMLAAALAMAWPGLAPFATAPAAAASSDQGGETAAMASAAASMVAVGNLIAVSTGSRGSDLYIDRN